ncbi:hypothetical protein LP420_07920 [Massilia sp. B-10]|nr:hypothetical protein LP420_07920 [Massilia sp. B-10]
MIDAALLARPRPERAIAASAAGRTGSHVRPGPRVIVRELAQPFGLTVMETADMLRTGARPSTCCRWPRP